MWRIKFLSTPSARRATFAVTAKRRKGNKFLSTPSARRATFWWADVPRICIEFLSTPSARRATEGGEYSRAGEWISIHALREEGDAACCESACVEHISIHALREEGDAGPRPHNRQDCLFLSTPSARRATGQFRPEITLNKFLSTPSARRATETGDGLRGCKGISIHALREEGDRNRRRATRMQRYFYPRPPRGGRHKAQR